MTVKSYVKKPVMVEALRLDWDTWNEMCEFAGVGKLVDGKPEGCMLHNGKLVPEGAAVPAEIGLQIPTDSGLAIAEQGDYVVKGIKGEFYPVKPDIFKATYIQVPNLEGVRCPECGAGVKQVAMPEDFGRGAPDEELQMTYHCPNKHKWSG